MEGSWKSWVLLVVVSLAFYQAAGTPVMSQKECTEDPSILCQDFATALKCGSLERCYQMLQVNNPKTFKCTICKAVVVLMAKIVQDNSTDERLAKFFERGCQYLPFQDWSVKCKKMVDTGIIILTELGKQVQFWQSSVDMCHECKVVADEIHDILKNSPFLIQTLQDYAKQQCESLGTHMADECKKYVPEYVHAFVQFLMHLLDTPPMGICSKIGFCDATKSEPFHPSKPVEYLSDLYGAVVKTISDADKPHLMCDICKKVVQVAENMVENNNTEEKIVHQMVYFCYMLPHEVVPQCRDFVNSYGMAVLTMLFDATKPDSVCIMLSFCPKDVSLNTKKIAPEKKVALEKVLEDKDGEMCRLCVVLVNYIDDQLQKNETQIQIGGFLLKGCQLLPEALVYPCDQLVDQYEPAAVQLLIQVLQPSFVCVKVGICPEHHLVGMEACSQGPAYWCKNPETAEQCQATEYCKSHMWN